MEHLGISRNTLRDARGLLKERGVIDFITQLGRGKAVRYLMLKTELAPEIKGLKFDPFTRGKIKGLKIDTLSELIHKRVKN